MLQGKCHTSQLNIWIFECELRISLLRQGLYM